jgi:hypothetical protein
VNSLDLQSILEEETVDGGEAILGKIRRRAALKLPCRWHTQKKAPKPNPTSCCCCCCCFLLILTGLGKSSYKLLLSQRHRQLSSILIPTSQQFDTEWVFWFFFFWVFLLLQSKSQLKSSPQWSSPPSSPNKFLRVQQIQKAKRSREQARTRKEQTNKAQGGSKSQ